MIVTPHPFHSISIDPSVPEIKVFQSLTVKIQGQDNGWGQRARSRSRSSIQLICFFFVSHPRYRQFMRQGYLKIWPWKIQGPGSGWCRRSRSPSIQSIHTLFVSRQSTNHSLDIGNRVFDIKTTHPMFFGKNSKNVSNTIPPKFNKILSMTRGIYIPRFMVTRRVVTFSCRQSNCVNRCHIRGLGWKSSTVIRYISPDLYFPCPKYLSLSTKVMTWDANVVAAADAVHVA